MKGLGLHVQRRAFGSALGVVLAVTSVARAETQPAAPSTTAPSPAPTAVTPAPSSTTQTGSWTADTTPAIVAARELFREATDDYDAGRFAIALEKFKRVAAVRETASVRFNIGKCQAALGRVGTALGDFEMAEREAPTDPKGDEIARLAREHASEVRSQVPRLTLLPPPGAPDGFFVALDGERIASASLGVPLPVDPGAHVVEATAPGRTAFRRDLQIAAGHSERLAIELRASDAARPGGDTTGPKPDEPSAPANPRRTWGIVAVGSGVALGVATIVFVSLHNSDVSDIRSACPTNPDGSVQCNPSQAGRVNDLQSSSHLHEGLGIATGIGAVAAVAVGAYLLLTPSSPSAQAPTPPAKAAWLLLSAPGAAAGASIAGRF